MANSLSLVWDLIAVDNASATFGRVGAAADTTSGSVKRLVEGFGALAVGGAIVESVKQAAEFQKQMLLVQTQAGATAQEVRNMTPAILSLAGQVAQAPEQLATSLYHVESTGLRGKAALDAVKVAAEGAKVGNADLEQTTNALTATIASGMLPATETYSQAMGQLNTIVGSGDMKMQDLNDSLSTGLLVTVKQYGVNLNDVGAALADFGDNNLRGADAATRLRMAVQALATQSAQGQGVLLGLGIKVNQLADDMAKGGLNLAIQDLMKHLQDSGIAADKWGQILTEAFTKKAGAGVLTLIGTFDRFQQKYQEVSKGADSFGNAWQATTKTASFKFSQLKDTVDALGISLGSKLLPVAGDFASWLSKTAIPDIEHFWSSVQQFTQSQGFQTFLRDVESIGAGALKTIQQFGSVLLDIGKTILPPLLTAGGDVVRWFSSLPGPVQEATAAFVALRIAAAKGMFDGLLSGAGAVRKAFRGFGADVVATAGHLDQIGVPLATFTATAQVTAERGFGALRSAGRGVMNMLGGPWGTSLAIAGGAVAIFASSLETINATAQKFTDALKQGSDTAAAIPSKLEAWQNRSISSISDVWDRMAGLTRDGIAQIEGYANAADKAKQQGQDAYNAWYESLDRVGKAQAAVTQATTKYNEAASQYGPASAQARDAASQLQQANQNLKVTQDDVNTATQTHLDLLKQQSDMELASVDSSLAAMQAQANLDSSIAQYNQDATDGQHTTAQLKQESANLAQQTITTAQAVARHAADQAKANGVTDTTITYQNTLHDTLVAYAKQLTGPVKDAVQKAADATNGAVIKTDDFRDATDKLGLMVGQSWPDGTKVVQKATSQQIEALKQLGYHVTTLPGSDPNKPQTIWVTANTDQAYNNLSDFLKKAHDLGFVGALYNLAPLGGPNAKPAPTSGLIGLPPIPNRATGGLMLGPGTGTSDSILARVSNGEFVVNAKATAENLPLLHSINSGVKHYAQGGLVWMADLSQQIKSNLSDQLNAVNNPYVGAVAGATSQAAVQLGARMAAAVGWGGPEFMALVKLWTRESGWNPYAVNPSSGAYGIPQSLGHGHPYNLGDSAAQIAWGINYIKGRYGDPLNAWAHEQAVGWYKNGTNWVPSDQLAFLHRGEAVVPASQNQGAPYQAGRAAPLMQIENMHVNDQVDLELALQQAQFRERAGVFS